MVTLSKIFTFFARLCICANIIAISWLYSGTPPQCLVLFTTLSVAAVVFEIFTKILNPYEKNQCGTVKAIYIFLSLFLLFVFIQSMNVRVERIQWTGFSFLIETEHIKWLPSSIGDNFMNFSSKTYFAIYLGIVCFFSSILEEFKNTRFLNFVLVLFATNTFFMGVFALWQKEHFDIIYNTYIAESDFFGSFPLSNAAGAFLSLGVVSMLSFALDLFKKPVMSTVSILASICISYAVWASGSMGASVFCVLIWVCYAVLLIYDSFADSKIGAKKIVMVSSIFVFLSIISSFILLKNTSYYNDELSSSMSSRLDIYEVDKDLIRANPMFGIGIGAFDFVATKMQVEKNGIYNVNNFISLNDPHSSVLFYPVSCGFFGSSILLLTFILWIVLFFKRRKFLTLGNGLLMVGALLCILYSIFDMHLSSIPSTMFAFSIICASAVSLQKEFFCE